jgi:type I restriction-modification system DNA methylase subunit
MLTVAADAMRVYIDASDYEHVVLGLIFLKHLPGAARRHKG